MIEHPHVRMHAPALGAMAGVESPYVFGDGYAVPVRVLWELHHRGGEPAEALAERYPKLGVVRVFSALAFCYDNEDLVEADITRERAAVEVWKEKRA